MIEVQLNHKSGKAKNKIFYQKYSDKAARILKIKKNYYLSLAIVSASEMKKLNRLYRKKNSVTDVLSFSEKETRGFLVEPDYLGEIVICLSQAEKQSRQRKIKLSEELAHLFAHGLLHLIGFNHQREKEAKKMANLEKKITLIK
ncbi:rRNA maturation RNase YbeY [Candidatus Parcubacteria bacterium]|nr:MAG: rRNA maturation RNase YbeY [Candidatus Parcubacteria bacterium]